MKTPHLAVFAFAAWLVSPAAAGPAPAEAPPVRALLITGKQNHNWRYTSRLHKDTLEATGRFAVDVTDEPAKALADAAAIGAYRVFVIDYNNEFGGDKDGSGRWGEPAESNFLKAVQGGTGVVFIHASNNAFKGWAEYEKMCGLLWRDGTGHGAFHTFPVKIVDRAHPITKGLPESFDVSDELYHKLVNTQGAKITVLAEAYADKESGGSGQSEPMALVLMYGKGRVFHTPLGHVWDGSWDSKASVSNPWFKSLVCRGTEWAATGDVTTGPEWKDVRTHNTLTPEEKAAGWVLLYDGSSAPKFRGYKKDALPAQWKFDGGVLHRPPGEGGGDIVTLDEYADFEFACDYMIAKGGNSGIVYRTTEDHDYCWETGPELQILDNGSHPDNAKGKTMAGALYDLMACAYDVARPPGEWNHVVIKVQGPRIEHWLNGWKVIDCDLAGEAYKEAHAASKWVKMPDFAKRAKGHIALQDHGDEVWFRDIKVRELK